MVAAASVNKPDTGDQTYESKLLSGVVTVSVLIVLLQIVVDSVNPIGGAVVSVATTGWRVVSQTSLTLRSKKVLYAVVLVVAVVLLVADPMMENPPATELKG